MSSKRGPYRADRELRDDLDPPESRADPETTINHVADRVLSILLWVKPAIRYQVMQRVDARLRGGKR